MWEGPLRPDSVFCSDCRGAKATLGRLLRQTADLSPAICSIVRALSAETDSRFFGIAFASRSLLSTNHFALPSSDGTRFSVHSPFNFFPDRKTVSDPFQ